MLNFIKNSDLFSGIEHEKIEFILNCIGFEVRKFEKDTYLYDISEGYKAGIVLNGVLDLIQIKEDGKEIIEKRYIKKDSFVFNFESMDESMIVTRTNSQILLINAERIFDDKKKDCKYRALFMENIIRVLNEEIKYLYFKSKIYSQNSLREKIIAFFEYELENSQSKEIKLIYNRNDLAKFLSCNRSALSRELSNMEKDKIIRIEEGSFYLI